jgi:hydroxymethylbilane synthase
MPSSIRIGTRDSFLAKWQAEHVQQLLAAQRLSSELVFIKSKGDLNRDQPLHQLGAIGVFTKALDDALLNNEIDLAVHSLKDVPTLPHEDLHQAAVLKRTSFYDVLIGRKHLDFIDDTSLPATIATGSIRRKAQWLLRFPHHRIVDIRGNVDTRLKKLKTENIDATILSEAGLTRLNIQPTPRVQLDWMVPAPAQGVIGLFCRKQDSQLHHQLAPLNDRNTALSSLVERQLLRELEGGCSAPIGALATIDGNWVTLTAILVSLDGKQSVLMNETAERSKAETLGKLLATEMLKRGGKNILNTLKNNG